MGFKWRLNHGFHQLINQVDDGGKPECVLFYGTITGVIVALFRRIVIGNTECFQRVFVVQFMILPG